MIFFNVTGNLMIQQFIRTYRFQHLPQYTISGSRMEGTSYLTLVVSAEKADKGLPRRLKFSKTLSRTYSHRGELSPEVFLCLSPELQLDLRAYACTAHDKAQVSHSPSEEPASHSRAFGTHRTQSRAQECLTPPC